MSAVYIVDRLSALSDTATSVAAPNNGDVLTYNSTTGLWTAAAPAGGGGSPGGADGQLQVKSGTAFAGAAGITWTSNQVRVHGQAAGTVPITFRPHADTWLPTCQFLDTAGVAQTWINYDGQFITKKAVTIGDIVPGTYYQLTTSGAGANLTITFNVASALRGELVFASGSNYLNLGNATSGMSVRLYDANTIDLGQPSFEGNGALSIAKTGTAVSVNNLGATVCPMAVTASVSQSADVARWRDGVGTVKARVDSGFTFRSDAGFKVDSSSGSYQGLSSSSNWVLWAGGSPNNQFTAAAGSHVAACYKAAGSQSANLVEFQDSGGNVKIAVSKGIYLFIANNAAPADGDLAANQVALWFDSSNGAAKLMAKGKSANGTVVSGALNLA